LAALLPALFLISRDLKIVFVNFTRWFFGKETEHGLGGFEQQQQAVQMAVSFFQLIVAGIFESKIGNMIFFSLERT
jgi:hypothetical protein